jgi:hypothetical protein
MAKEVGNIRRKGASLIAQSYGFLEREGIGIHCKIQNCKQKTLITGRKLGRSHSKLLATSA